MKPFSYKPIFEKTVLDNGVRVVTESHPFTQAVSVGVFVGVGTRDEAIPKAGLTHFLEHLVFKGTRKRSAFDLACALDAVGGDLNAYTSKEYTCFHATSLKEHLKLSIDVLADLVTGAVLARDDFKKEREVIVQEIQMSKDNLEEHILDSYLEKVFAGHALATPILGTEETLATLRSGDLRKHYDSWFCGEHVIVSVAGAVEHDQVLKLVAKAFSRMKSKGKKHKRTTPRIRRVQDFTHRPSEQVHMVIGLPSCPFNSKLRFESYVVNEILGGGVTSRLYQNVREDKGLVYGIGSFLQAFMDTGLFLITSATSADNTLRVMKSIRTEIRKIIEDGIKPRELAMFKTQVKGQIVLGSEDMENRMNSLGVNEMVFGEYRPVDTVINDIEKVDLKSVRDYMHKYFDIDQVSLMVMGDLQPPEALALMNVWEK